MLANPPPPPPGEGPRPGRQRGDARSVGEHTAPLPAPPDPRELEQPKPMWGAAGDALTSPSTGWHTGTNLPLHPEPPPACPLLPAVSRGLLKSPLAHIQLQCRGAPQPPARLPCRPRWWRRLRNGRGGDLRPGAAAGWHVPAGTGAGQAGPGSGESRPPTSHCGRGCTERGVPRVPWFPTGFQPLPDVG